MSTYTYTKATNLLQLESEIRASSITVALDNISAVNNDISIIFKAPLSLSEETTLDDLVSDHVAQPDPPMIQTVALNHPIDSDGSPLLRTKIAPSGWHYQLHGLEITTATLNGVVEQKPDCTPFNFTNIAHYDSNNSLLTTQQDIDSSCVRTVVDWEPNWDYEMIGGSVYQYSAPNTDVRLGIVAAPYVPLNMGGSVVFGSNINLRYVDNSGSVSMDGRSPKRLVYNATYHTSMLRLIINHSAGVKHSFLTLFELFKPGGV